MIILHCIIQEENDNIFGSTGVWTQGPSSENDFDCFTILMKLVKKWINFPAAIHKDFYLLIQYLKII
jgi:hypothetical protein